MRHPFPLCLCLCLCLIGCVDPFVESVESEDIHTSGLYADYSARTENGGLTEVSAYLHVGSSTSLTYVNLGSGDALSASTGETTISLEETNLGDLYGYYGDLPVNAEGTEITISLERSADTAAPDSTCTLPSVPVLTAPIPGHRFSRTEEGLDIAWTPDDTGTITVEVDGLCISGYDQALGTDSGSLSLDPGVLSDDEDTASADEDCAVTVTVTRSQRGSLDDALEGGTIVCEQRQSIEITATP